jgi:hypothetical protein
MAHKVVQAEVNMSDIFVSYARKDIDRVNQIMEDLHQSGFDYWMDRDDIRTGADWREAITAAISGCKIFLLFMSIASMDSDNVQREVRIAHKFRKPIIILRLENVDLPNTMLYMLEGIQWTEFSDPDWQRKITQELGRHLKNPVSGPVEDVKKPAADERVGAAYPKPSELSKKSSGNQGFVLYASVAVVLLAVVGILAYWFFSSRTMSLSTFDQNTQNWQPEKQTDAKPEYAATVVSWDEATNSLRAEFDFGQVNPNALSGDVEPRATFFVKGAISDWSAFRTLMFDVNNPTSHDFRVVYSISNSDCWYEFGGYQPVPQRQVTSLRFDLLEPRYKTCRNPESYTNPAPPLDEVWRFDIIVGTDESPWDSIRGALLIDDIKLTDRGTVP